MVLEGFTRSYDFSGGFRQPGDVQEAERTFTPIFGSPRDSINNEFDGLIEPIRVDTSDEKVERVAQQVRNVPIMACKSKERGTSNVCSSKKDTKKVRPHSWDRDRGVRSRATWRCRKTTFCGVWHQSNSNSAMILFDLGHRVPMASKCL